MLPLIKAILHVFFYWLRVSCTCFLFKGDCLHFFQWLFYWLRSHFTPFQVRYTYVLRKCLNSTSFFFSWRCRFLEGVALPVQKSPFFEKHVYSLVQTLPVFSKVLYWLFWLTTHKLYSFFEVGSLAISSFAAKCLFCSLQKVTFKR